MAVFHGTEALRLGEISWLSTFLFLHPVYLMVTIFYCLYLLGVSVFQYFFAAFAYSVLIQSLKHSSLVCTNSLLICLSLVCAFLEDMLHSATQTKFLRILVHHAISLMLIRGLCASHCSGCCVLVVNKLDKAPALLDILLFVTVDSKQVNEMLTLW